MFLKKLKRFVIVVIALIFDRCFYCLEALEEHFSGRMYCTSCGKLN